MRQAVLSAAYQINLQQAEVPKISANQVLLKVANVGICGSDIQMYHGRHKYMTYPVIPGHEVSGVVVEAGSDVTRYAVGDKVTVEPQVYCGECYPCSIGRFNVCEHLKVLGVHLDGFAREFTAVDQKYLHPCPQSMDLDLITLAEPLAVAVGAVKRSRYKDANIAVLGAGSIGNMIAQSAKALGAKDVLITDIVDNRLAFAKKCGIEKTANTKDISLQEAIHNAFGNRKADVIIDAAASIGSFQSAITAARPESEIIITGNYKEPVQLEVPMLQRREVNLIGHMMYVREDFTDAIRFLSEGTVEAKEMITKKFGLEQFSEAFEYIDSHTAEAMKVLIGF